MKRWMQTGGALMLIAALLLAGCVPVPQPEQPAAAGVNVRTEKALVVENYITDQGTLDVAGNTTVGGNLNVTGTASITGGYTTGTSTIYEGATANDFETTLAVTDPTADRTLTLPNETAAVMVSSLVTNGTAITNSVTGASNGLVFEGATANDHETTITPTDPTADRTITLPNLSGSVLLTTNPGKVVFGSNTITGTLQIAHGLTTPEAAFCDLGANATANAATCSTAIVTSTVTVKVWKADGVTAASAAVKVDWLVAGQP